MRLRTLALAATPCLALLALPAAALAADAASAPAPAARYAVSADGQEVTDTTTHLVWRRCVEGASWDGHTCQGKATRFTFADAKKAAAAAGHGWRVPTKDELTSLVVTPAKRGPHIDLGAFPAAPATSTWASRPGFDDNLNAWLVNFSSGRAFGNSGHGTWPLRLVKAG